MRVTALLLLMTYGLAGVVEPGVAGEMPGPNGMKVYYDALLQPRCDLFLRHRIGNMLAGYRLGNRLIDENYAVTFTGGYKYAPHSLCERFRISAEDGVVYRSEKSGEVIRKRDLISLDEMMPWGGRPPFRVRFNIIPVDGEYEDDVDRSYLPYDRKNRIDNYLIVDDQGYELNIPTRERTGYRFYNFMGQCYLATEKKPRVYKYETLCVHAGSSAYEFPPTVDTTNHRWINITQQNTIDQNSLMPAVNVEVDGAQPLKPVIYSDAPLDDSGRVIEGRAMCMADCAPGMLFKLLHKGQSIWGASGR